MRGLIILVLCSLLPIGYSKESYLLKPSQLTEKINNEGGSEVEPEDNRSQPYSFTSTIYFDLNTGPGGDENLHSLGVLITLSHVLTDILRSIEINILLPSGEPMRPRIPLTKAWVGTFYGFGKGYYSYISNIHYSGQDGLSIVVLETAAVLSPFISLAYIPRRIDHGDLCELVAVNPIYNMQKCRLEPLGMRIYETGEVKIRATPQRQAYDIIRLGGPLFYTNKLIAIYGAIFISREEGIDWCYKNISNHMQFINRFAPIQEYDMFIHDPMFPIPQ